MNTKDKGDITEAVITAEFLKAGFVVLRPVGDNQRYDLVVEIKGEFRRIQCKTARCIRDGSSITFSSASTYAHRGGKRKDYKGAVDFFAVYYPMNNSVYVIPVDDAGCTSMTLRIDEPRNNQNRKVRWASCYLLENFAP